MPIFSCQFRCSPTKLYERKILGPIVSVAEAIELISPRKELVIRLEKLEDSPQTAKFVNYCFNPCDGSKSSPRKKLFVGDENSSPTKRLESLKVSSPKKILSVVEGYKTQNQIKPVVEVVLAQPGIQLSCLSLKLFEDAL